MKKKKSVGKIIGIVAGCIVAAVAVFGISCYLILLHYINKRNYVPTNENFTILDETPSFIEDVLNPTSKPAGPDTDKSEVESYKNDVESRAEDLNNSEEMVQDVENILLIGSDMRPDEDVGRSDTMILISINKETKRIVATSFLRDTYVKIPVMNEFHKLNAAYAYGGIELLYKTLEYNYGITVDNYIAVDFVSFIDAIDILGGIDVQVYEDELYWFNQYIHASNLLVEPPEREDSDYVDYADGSYQHLNGKQALAYARFRYVGNGDFTRTDRQRRVVQEIFEKIKTINPSTLREVLGAVIPQITTDMKTDKCLSYILRLPELSQYEVISWHIPDEDFKYMTIDGDDVVAIDFSYYMKKLYNYIYTDAEPETDKQN